MGKNVILDKSFDFAVRIIILIKYIVVEKKEYALSKQIIRSGTVGALKEANKTNYIENEQFKSLQSDIQELLKLLVSIIKSLKSKKNG